MLDLGIAANPEEIRNPNAVSHLTGDSVTGEKWCTGEGTADSPYIFLVTPDGTVAGSFFNRMREKGGYFRIEVREGNTYKGALMKAWEQGAGDLRELEEEAVYQVGLAVGEALPEEPEETPTPTPTETPTPTPSPTGEPTPAPTETPTPSPTEEPTETPTPTPSPTEEPTPTPTETPTPAPTQEPTPSPTQPPAATGEPEAQTEEADGRWSICICHEDGVSEFHGVQPEKNRHQRR
ncbi:MAG: hypothetical protein ACLRT5_10045 [Lachnospiraceae bacterium]